ncbi:MAG: Ldh family oxidoreductase [Deltaproteobacteria bacterium]|nr:Ldh family oxidoreductase [Deltaproteobacteria bacterium]
MAVEEMVKVTKVELKETISSILAKVGVPPEDAEVVAEVMADTNAKGIESHGIRWLDIYVQRIKAGGYNPVTKLEVVKDKGSLLLLNANHGLGQVAMVKAVDLGLEKARQNAVAIVAVANSNHFGATCFYTERAAKAGLIGFACTNSTPLMAPWGGMDLCVGTNPLSFGFPTKGVPIILDMATTAFARGKVFIAERQGTTLPEGVALNKNGEPTTNPKEALEGIMLPAAGPKGFGLSLAIDILSGILIGSNHGHHICSLFGDLDKHQDVGHFAIFINIDDFINPEIYYREIEDSVSRMKSSRLAKGFTQIFMPGEIEDGQRAKNLAEGIPIPLPTWKTVQELKAKL